MTMNSGKSRQRRNRDRTVAASPPGPLRESRPIRLPSASFLILALISVSACAGAREDREFTLQDVQGFWWERCDDPAVRFAIDGDRYFGDFEGQYSARVERGVLIVDQSPGPALTFRILEANSQRLVLRSTDPTDEPASDWVLRTCPKGQP